MYVLALLVHAAATLFMTGVIWVVQVVHYPLFARVGRDGFASYERSHTTRIGLVVMPAMLIELGSGLLLLKARFIAVPDWAPVAGVGLLTAIWLSTFLQQVPRHRVLERGFDERTHRALVATNWTRTLLWTARGALVLWMVYRVGFSRLSGAVMFASS